MNLAQRLTFTTQFTLGYKRVALNITNMRWYQAMSLTDIPCNMKYISQELKVNIVN